MQQRFLLQILLLAQHVSGITMPTIRSSRVLYSGCCLWYLVLWFCLQASCKPDTQPSAPHQTSNLKTSVASRWHFISTCDYPMYLQSLQKCWILCDTSYHDRICGLGWATKPNVRFSWNLMYSSSQSNHEVSVSFMQIVTVAFIFKQKNCKFHENLYCETHNLLKGVNKMLPVSYIFLSDLDTIC